MDENIKQKFQKLIEYQKKDIELRKLNAVIDRDEALAGMNKHKRAFNDAKQAIKDCEVQAGSLIDTYAELQKYVADNEELLAALDAVEAASEDELAERVKKLESLKSKFASADKKAHDIDERSKELLRARTDAVKTGNAAKAKYNEAKSKHEALIGSKSSDLERLKAELEKLRSGLDEALFREYSKLVAENKFPPVVPASGDDKKGMFNCGGCGLGLPQSGNAELNDKGYCRCDSCRRLIVKLR